MGFARGGRSPLVGRRRPLRFAVGARVECRMGQSLWVKAVVVAQHPSSGDPAPAPYEVRLEDGSRCFAPVDTPAVIRAEAGEEEIVWNPRAQALEVAANTSLALHPSSSRLAIGLWRDGVAAGVLYSVDFRESSVTVD